MGDRCLFDSGGLKAGPFRVSRFNSTRIVMRKIPGRNAKGDFRERVADVFHRASLALEMLRHHPQILTQRFIALSDVISNFAAFELYDRRVADPPPSYPLSFLQLFNLAGQNIGLSHASSLLNNC
jgi:hypothetical protein